MIRFLRAFAWLRWHLLLNGIRASAKRDTWEQGFKILLREMEGDITERARQKTPTITLKTNLGPDLIHHAGDDVVISVNASADCFFGLFSIDSRGDLRQVRPSSRIFANQTIQFVDPTIRSNNVFGVKTLIGVASIDPIPLENQSRWNSFAESLRSWASSTAAPKRAEGREIAVLRYLAAP